MKTRMRISEVIKNLVAFTNMEQGSSLCVGDTISITLREDYSLSDTFAADVEIVNKSGVSKNKDLTAESFREAIVASFNACHKPIVAKPFAPKKPAKEWSRTVPATRKGLNIPVAALEYLIPNRSRYTPLYLRPFVGVTNSFLVNATRGDGVCYEIYPQANGRYMISRPLQKKIFGHFVDGWAIGDSWTVKRNGNTGNSVIFTRN